ncbi:uncharacterized protein BDV14DRAFT_110902 [Aspergillus stella-maris]|uniref:uncharacterized protein n=1 Tax=Aspergillus stella-maris TaxID=1810926 RepID=UPI003CCE1521
MARQNPVPLTYIGREENLEELEDREARKREQKSQRTSREESPTRIFSAEEERADLAAGRRPTRRDGGSRSRSRSRDNSRIRLRARRDSLSISPPFRRRYRSPSPPRLECFTSHSELFSTLTSKPEASGKDAVETRDRYILLTPFMRETYITSHPASKYDFSTWLPLLALGVPETWYAFGVSEQPIQLSTKQPLLAPQNVSLLPQKEAGPVGLRVPRIVAGAALLPPPPTPIPVNKDPFDDNDTPVKNEDGSKPRRDLVYLSIQSTISGTGTHRLDRYSYSSPDRNGLPDLAGSSITGQNIYRVVRAGSREEAAAQAFYVAGGNKWSTLFTCAVIDEGRGSGRVVVCDEDVYRRVGSVEELGGSGGGGEKGSRMKVFY